MQIQSSRYIMYIFLMLFSVLSISSCTNDYAAAVRKVTYPQDFKYVSGQELRSNMHRLAYQLQQLDKVLADVKTPQIEHQQQVLDLLNNIKTISASLQAGNAGASHAFLEDFMQEFVSQIDTAHSAASLAQPRYYFAGKNSRWLH
jgi:hypothetical protein